VSVPTHFDHNDIKGNSHTFANLMTFPMAGHHSYDDNYNMMMIQSRDDKEEFGNMCASVTSSNTSLGEAKGVTVNFV
jgi:hypothetical protein